VSLCPECGVKISVSDKFCRECGTKISKESSQPETIQRSLKKCRECGEENLYSERSCSYCGSPFIGDEEVFVSDVTTTHTQRVETPLKKVKVKKSASLGDSTTAEKSIETWKVISIIVMAIIIGIFILLVYSEQNTIPTSVQNIPQAQQQKVDLAKFNEINQLESELASDSKNSEKLLRLANLTHDAGLFDKSIKNYELYLALKPNDTDARVDMGVCYFELKNYDKAEEIFLASIKRSPKHQIAHLNLGVVHLSKGNVDKAKEWLEKCIALGEHTDVGHRASELLKTH